MSHDLIAAGFEMRRGNVGDAPCLARHRCEMFREMGALAMEDYDALFGASVAYFREAVRTSEYLAWLVGKGDDVVAGGGMRVGSVPPRPDAGSRLLDGGSQGLILNMFVEPEYRRRGIAKWLLESMIDYAREATIPSLVLHASSDGRKLYEQLGFLPTNEMRLLL